MERKKFKVVWRDLSLKNEKDNTLILKGLDGMVESGNFLSIMGPSGAGKSSLLALLTARMRKHNTSLKIGGEVIAQQS
jgi:ABC-type multidrug transport system ATPase subunit